MSDEPTEPPVPEETKPSPQAEAAAASQVANQSLAQMLDRHTVPGTLWKTEGDRVRCVACAHRCLLALGRRGVCKLRFNQGGQLRGKGLGRADANFRSGVGVDGAVGLARHHAAQDVADGQGL